MFTVRPSRIDATGKRIFTNKTKKESVTPPQNKHFNCHAMWNKLDFEGVLQNFCSEWYKTNQTKHSDLNVPGQILIEVNSVLLKKKIFPGSLRLTSIVCQHNYLFSFTVINIRTGNSFRIQTNLAIFYSRIEFEIRFVLLLSRRSCLSVGVYRTVSQSNMFPTISIAY